MSSDPLRALRGKYQVEESRLSVKHGSKVRSGLWTVSCTRCPTVWTVQVKENGETAPPIDVLLEHARRHT